VIVEFQLQDLRVARTLMREDWGDRSMWSAQKVDIYKLTAGLGREMNRRGYLGSYRIATNGLSHHDADASIMYLVFTWVHLAAEERKLELRGDPAQLET